MKMRNQRTTFIAMMGLILAFTLFLGGCSDVRPIDSQTPTAPSTTPNAEAVKVTYNYSDSGNVTLSANNITLQKGQTLILEPAAGLTKKTRFLSSGENFFNDVMEQVKTDNSKLVFVAKAPGKGKLQIIPNYTETDRAIDFWVTVR
ncbi:hypothetical protein AXX12_10495 [Anaerosporomusa subterranea]|uniref:Uncharacterized protein n=1 Tax=Anaerosporomusa subterranea TaxID=1794912 RepID=A0A154BP26_ANASB|nr:hypothetical protein [Anaerosporomusa subterranea]KYZ75635.1 hypothetical protein AXX12_10495 [Anaerosporomusa subterranea]